MKSVKLFSAAVLSLLLVSATAQTETPKGYGKGSVVLPDNSVVSGYIKDNIRKDAAVVLLENGKEKTYDGSAISSAEIDGTSYICIRGDFFKVLCQGELCFFQKASNASSKPTYSGNEVLFISGTEGKPGDYFIYTKDHELQLVSRKNLDALAAGTFSGYAPAQEKVKACRNDLSQVKEAVELYNKRNG